MSAITWAQTTVPLELSKDYKIHEKRGAEKSRKRGRRDRKGRGKHGERGQIEM